MISSRSADRSRAAARCGAAGGAARVAEEHVEDVAEAPDAEVRSPPAPPPAVADAAETIVLRALLRIGEHFVGFVDLFEAVLGPRFVVRDVGMVLARERAIRSLDLIGDASRSTPRIS